MRNVGAFGFLDYWHGSHEELRLSVTFYIEIHTGSCQVGIILDRICPLIDSHRLALPVTLQGSRMIMNENFKMMRKEISVAYFKLPMPEWIEGQEIYQDGRSLEPKFELGLLEYET
jgi:hypothetical protein